MSTMLHSFKTKNTCDQEAKFIQDRIISVEKNIGELCHIFAQYSRKVARIRDKGDEVAKSLLTIAENETINKSMGIGLENLADCVSNISDYGDLRVQNLDNKVVGEFSRYEDICKLVKEDIKDIFNAREKEINRRRHLDRIRDRNPRNRQQIIDAETELVKATAEVSKSVHNLEDKITSFERQKLHDIKSILLDFIVIEMGYHSKTLQVLTKAYNDIDAINEDSDVEEFKKQIQQSETLRDATKKVLFKSTASLGSLGAIFATSHSRRTHGIPKAVPRLQSKSDETLDSIKRSISESEDTESEVEEDEISEEIKNTTDSENTDAVTKSKV